MSNIVERFQKLEAEQTKREAGQKEREKREFEEAINERTAVVNRELVNQIRPLVSILKDTRIEEILKGIQKVRKDLNFNIDIVKPEKEEISYHTGMEWWLKNILVVRGGYKYDSAMATLGPLAGLTAGAGFKINIFDIDYAFVPYGDLGLTHRISLLAKF